MTASKSNAPAKKTATTETKVDEAQLLADLEAKAKAKAEEPTAPVAKAEEPDGDTLTVRNISQNPRRINGTVVAPEATYTLRRDELENKRLMAKVDHALRLGTLTRVVAD